MPAVLWSGSADGQGRPGGASSRPHRLPCYGSVLADIGDEQSLSASLSTFSGHLRRIEVSQGISVAQRPPSCGIETDAMHYSSAARCSASGVLLGLPGLGSWQNVCLSAFNHHLCRSEVGR